MKAAIETLQVERSDLRAFMLQTMSAHAAAQMRELDRAITLLEAGEVLVRLAKAVCDPAGDFDTTASAQEQMDASARFREAIDAAKRDPLVQKLIAESE